MTEALGESCPHCGRPRKPGAAFCGGCGKRVHVPVPVVGGGEVRMVITYYVMALLASAAGMIYARLTEDVFTVVVGVTVSFTVITLGFAFRHRALIVEPSRRPGFSLKGYALILVASVPIVALVALYVHYVHRLFGIHVPGELADFAGRSVLWPIVLVVILAPLEEELAFRGLIYAGLRRSFTVPETFLVSSFAFAMLHLSVPSLVTHLPFGLYLCWLRHRSGSLWPGVFAHACHNLGTCVLAWS